MATALALGRRGLGCVWPNPAVGCVIVDSHGAVAGRGWTQSGGRPHAETEALLRAGKRADFTVLEQDPFEIGAQGLKDIEIWGTVFGGAPHKIDK